MATGESVTRGRGQESAVDATIEEGQRVDWGEGAGGERRGTGNSHWHCTATRLGGGVGARRGVETVERLQRVD